MKKQMLMGSALIAGIVLIGGACQSEANVATNSAMNKPNANMPANMSTMPMSDNSNMAGMMEMKSSPNAASQPYDLQFIDTMTRHHRGAVDMAKMALAKTSNEELKKFAQKIIDDQTKEIGQMTEWRDKWFSGKPMAMNMEMPGMMDSMKMMSGDGMKKMDAIGGKEFDIMFLDMMTPHHAGAITMAKEALTKAEHPEIKTLSGQIIKAQETEIKQMAEWKSQWSK